MKTYRKILFLIFIPIFIFSCGYQPMFKDLKNLNFVLKINNSSGNEKINRLIKSKLKGYSNQNDNENYKKYNVEFTSEYKKLIVAKDTTGSATEYKISIKSKFKITSGELKKEFEYIESFNMKSFSDRIDEQDYEKNIQDSLVNIITKKLIQQLSQIK